jgi:hypothetical protein
LADQPYTNVFTDVHNKIKELKDRTAAANRYDREIREGRVAEEAKKLREFGGK